MKRYVSFAIIVGLLLVIYSFLNFSLNQLWDWVSTVSLILGLIIGGSGIYYYFQFRQKKISKTTLKYGTNTLIASLIVLGIIALLAFISNRHHFRSDWTSTGLYSLADQTISVLKDLAKDVQIYGFYKKSDEIVAKDTFEEYAYRTDHLKYEFVDPNEKPQLARQYNITQYNTIVVESGTKRETLTELSESNLTNAIMKVTRELDKVIYFTTGHNERDFEDEGPQGYKTVGDGIINENYLLEKLNLAESRSIPEDCSVLVIAGPRSNFFKFELDTIKKYIDAGGKLFVMIDPQWKPDLVEFLKQYKIKVGDNIIVDPNPLGQLFGMGPEIPLVSEYENHDMFKEFRTMTFYPLSCSIETITEGESGFTTQTLFKTSSSSWGESDYMTQPVSFNEGKDVKGPVPLAVLSSKSLGENEKAEILVVGDSDFAINAYVKNSGNYDLFLNTINWLAEEEDMITIRPKEIDDRRVTLNARDSKKILYSSVFGLPLLIIIIGVSIYFKRR
jgi:ABC-type uncharacterized transport system involved in gliding motility auxiliary subunit